MSEGGQFWSGLKDREPPGLVKSGASWGAKETQARQGREEQDLGLRGWSLSQRGGCVLVIFLTQHGQMKGGEFISAQFVDASVHGLLDARWAA